MIAMPMEFSTVLNKNATTKSCFLAFTAFLVFCVCCLLTLI